MFTFVRLCFKSFFVLFFSLKVLVYASYMYFIFIGFIWQIWVQSNPQLFGGLKKKECLNIICYVTLGPMRDSKRNFDFEKKWFFKFFFFFGCLASAKSRGGTFGLQFIFFYFRFDLQSVRVRKLFRFDVVRFRIWFGSGRIRNSVRFRVAKRFRLLIRFRLINRVKLILAKKNQIK